MRKTTSKRLVCLALSVLMTLGTAAQVLVGAADDNKSTGTGTSLQAISDALNTISYEKYREMYKDVPRGDSAIVINAVDYSAEKTDAQVSVVSNYCGKSGDSLTVGDEGKVTWEITVPKSGLYALNVEYCSVSDKKNSIERVLYINDKVPFSEARFVQMKKKWVNEYTDGRFEVDSNGNEIRPVTSVVHEWQNYDCIDSTGCYVNPFEFYLEEGVNTITLEGVRESVVLHTITFYPYEENITYDEYIAGKSEAVAEPIFLEAELPSLVSDYTIYPSYDRKSSITSPQHATQIKLNTIGGEKWAKAGQYIEYTFTVETAGLYQIVTRYRQDVVDGMYTSRKILIDGEVPFEEANYCKFYYNTSWQVAPLGNGADEFQFYLEPGTHTLRMEVTLGEMGNTVRQVTDIMDSANKDYLEIMKLTGPVPDTYRDYGFGRVMPHVLEDFVIQSIALNNVAAYLESAGEMKSSSSTQLQTVARRLESMGVDADKIAANMTNLKSDISTLGSWLSTAKNQPLELDYIIIQPVSEDLPKAEANFLQALIHEIKQFIGSFFTDYNSLGSDGTTVKKEKHIDVWVSTGRDQAQIIRNLIDNDFIANTNIDVTMKLVSSDTLLPSVLAGVGPDVALPGVGADPIQYALRSAVLAVNPEAYADEPDATEQEKEYNAKMREIFSDFDEVAARFPEAAMIPITLYGKTYALPETCSWNMMFYRKDILADLGLELPKTWDDLMAMIPVLQFNNMEIAMPSDMILWLYQLEGELYADDGMRINIDSHKALEAFEIMCDYFTQYSLPYTEDFANRFKTGEMPIGIVSYSMYNNLTVFASEIAGLWDFAPIPGMVDEEGNINNVTLTSVTGLVMMSGTKDVAASWEFMKWYTDTKFQVDYSNELVVIMGDAAKNATANMEALEQLPWTSSEYRNLMAQMQNLISYPQYPGNYYLARYLNFAFMDAYNGTADPIDSLLQYVNDINKEISRKRSEFELETLPVGSTLASKRMDQIIEILEKMDESAKSPYNTTLEALKAAYAEKDYEAMRSAAAVLAASSDADILQISKYATDSANALESYTRH